METVPEPEPLEIGAEVKARSSASRENVAFWIIAAAMASARSASCARRTSCTPRSTSWSCSRAPPRSSSCCGRVRRLGAGARLHRRDHRPVPVRHHAHARADAARGAARQQPALAGRGRARCSSSACSTALLVDAYGGKEIKLTDELVLIGSSEHHRRRASSATTSSRSKSSSMLLLAALVGAVVLARRD